MLYGLFDYSYGVSEDKKAVLNIRFNIIKIFSYKTSHLFCVYIRNFDEIWLCMFPFFLYDYYTYIYS